MAIEAETGMPYQALVGFFKSLIELAKIDMNVPHYSLFCKRAKEVAILFSKLSSRRDLAILIDSTLKISGEGAWKTHKHGREKKRRG